MVVTAHERYALELEAEYRKRRRLRDRDFPEYRQDPMGFLVKELGILPESLDWELLPEYRTHEWDKTRNPLKCIMEALADWKDVGVEAATGTQKSFTAAGLVLWFAASWMNSRTFTFAPKEEQLRKYIWAEMSKLFHRFKRLFPEATLTDLCLRVRGGIDDTWGAWGYSVAIRADEEVSTKAAGMHAEHMLLIYEETPGISPKVIAAGENTCTAPHNLRLYLGNPDHQLDPLHQACQSPGVEHIIISALDHPNLVTGRTIVPGAASVESVGRRLLKYGKDHRIYRSRVRGESPAEAADALIKMSWIKAAIERYNSSVEIPHERLALGGDVANSEGGDDGAKAYMRGKRLIKLEAKPCPNSNDFGMEVGREISRLKIDPSNVGIDSVGVGAGAVNELRKRKEWHGVHSLNGGAKPWAVDWDAEEYNNLRSQIWWWLAEDFRCGEIDIPGDDLELIEDLITPTYETRNGKIVVESKEDIKERLQNRRSPNKGDALAYVNFVRYRPEPRKDPAKVDYSQDRSRVSWATGREPQLTPITKTRPATGHLPRLRPVPNSGRTVTI